MKYILLVGDGMADYPLDELGGKTPLEASKTPNMDAVVSRGMIGRVRTIPAKMKPASDVANLTILGYECRKYYTGRGPLEAANMGVELMDNDVAFRCNLVTAVGEILQDYSAGHIKTSEAKELIEFLEEKLGDLRVKFYPGVSYRHLVVVKNGAAEGLEYLDCKAPHDVTGQKISRNLPKGENADFIIDLMQKSRALLEMHEVNQVRVDLKENPATMIWLWGQGRRPSMPTFKEKFGLSGAMISAVDLLKGMAKLMGMDVINVPGATGYYDTDYEGKANAAIKALEKRDFVYVHVEAPDEAGHNGHLREKILAIERFDQFVVGGLLKAFARRDDFRLLVLPDHATPIPVRTHVDDPVLFAMCGAGITPDNASCFTEKEAEGSGVMIEEGHELMNTFVA